MPILGALGPVCPLIGNLPSWDIWEGLSVFPTPSETHSSNVRVPWFEQQFLFAKNLMGKSPGSWSLCAAHTGSAEMLNFHKKN